MTERPRVAVDLDGTLVDRNGNLRPGALEFLTAAAEIGNLVLYTSATKIWVDRVFELSPELKARFVEVVSRENMPTHGIDPYARLTEKQQLQLDIDRGFSGAKNPLLINCPVIIEDNSAVSYAGEKLGFEVVLVPAEYLDKTDQWVLNAVVNLRAIFGKE